MTENNAPRNPSRRDLLAGGGLLAAASAALAACGGSSSAGIARIGSSGTLAALPDVTVNDVVLVRTAMSMEMLAHRLLTSDEVGAAASSSAAPIVSAFAAAHSVHHGELASLVARLGGEAVDAPNAKLMSVYGDKVLGLVAASDQKAADVLVLLAGIEDLLAATNQLLVASAESGAVRGVFAALSAASARRAAVATQTINPGVPAIVPGTDDAGNATIATLPHAFGQTTAVQVTLGKANDAGVRTVVTMDTPSLNSYVY